MTFDGASLFAIAESPKEKGLIWTGSNDGQVQLTRDAGKTWTNVTTNLPNLPPWGHDSEHRAVTLRRRHRVHHGRPAPGRQLRSVRLQDGRLRQDVDAHQRLGAEVRVELRARRAGGSGAEGNAVRRHGQRPLRRWTTAGTGSRFRTTCRRRRFIGSRSRSTSTISSSPRTGAASGSSTTSRP